MIRINGRAKIGRIIGPFSERELNPAVGGCASKKPYRVPAHLQLPDNVSAVEALRTWVESWYTFDAEIIQAHRERYERLTGGTI